MIVCRVEACLDRSKIIQPSTPDNQVTLIGGLRLFSPPCVRGGGQGVG